MLIYAVFPGWSVQQQLGAARWTPDPTLTPDGQQPFSSAGLLFLLRTPTSAGKFWKING